MTLTGASVKGTLRLVIELGGGTIAYAYLKLCKPAPTVLDAQHGIVPSIGLDAATRQAVSEALARARQAAGVRQARGKRLRHTEKPAQPLTASLGAMAVR